PGQGAGAVPAGRRATAAGAGRGGLNFGVAAAAVRLRWGHFRIAVTSGVGPRLLGRGAAHAVANGSPFRRRPAMTTDDELTALLRRARHGEPQALADLLDELRAWVRSLAPAELRQRPLAGLEASDIAQEVCLRAFSKLDQFAGATVAELRAWVLSIQRNFLADK